MLGSFNNCNIPQLSHKATSSEEIEKNCQVVLNSIIENVSSLVKPDKYGTINTIDTTTMVYYVIKFIPEPYTLQEETIWSPLFNNGLMIIFFNRTIFILLKQ